MSEYLPSSDPEPSGDRRAPEGQAWLRKLAHLWSTTAFGAADVSAYAERRMVDETRAGVMALSVVLLLLLLGSLLVREHLGLGAPYVYTSAALSLLCMHVYYSARALREIKALHALGMVLLVVGGSGLALVAHQMGDFGVALLAGVVFLFMTIPMVPWGLREASLVTLLVYGLFSSSTWSAAQRFSPDTLWALHAFMLAGAALSLTLVARGAGVRKEDLVTRFQLESAHRQMERLSYHDPLTGVWNRRFIETQFAGFVERVQKSSGTIFLGLLDIDDFKTINDTHGHATGDRVLQRVAAALAARLEGAGHVVRVGGDEFMLLFESEDPEPLIHEAFEDLVVDDEPGASDVPVSISVGLSSLRGSGPADFENVYRAADWALYRAKRASSRGLSPVRIVRASIRKGEDTGEPFVEETLP